MSPHTQSSGMARETGTYHHKHGQWNRVIQKLPIVTGLQTTYELQDPFKDLNYIPTHSPQRGDYRPREETGQFGL